MKGSSATSASPNATPTPAVARRSASSPTRADTPPGGYPLAGPSNLPDPRTHAYRADLADARLAGHVIASHYADPLERVLNAEANLLAAPAEEAEVIALLPAGTRFSLLDLSRGWAWGYAGAEQLVGYVQAGLVERA